MDAAPVRPSHSKQAPTQKPLLVHIWAPEKGLIRKATQPLSLATQGCKGPHRPHGAFGLGEGAVTAFLSDSGLLALASHH